MYEEKRREKKRPAGLDRRSSKAKRAEDWRWREVKCDGF